MENPSMTKDLIMLVPFPFDDFSDAKIRPALCLTNPIGKFEHIIIAFISSNTSNPMLHTDILIKHKTPEWEKTNLAVDSVIRLHKLVTIPKYLIKRKLGVLTPAVQKEIRQKISQLFELE